MLTSLSSHNGCHSALVKEVLATPLSELLTDFSKFVELVETTIDLELTEHHEFLIKPSFDEKLQGINMP